MEKDPDSEVKICSEWPRSTNRSSSYQGIGPRSAVRRIAPITARSLTPRRRLPACAHRREASVEMAVHDENPDCHDGSSHTAQHETDKTEALTVGHGIPLQGISRSTNRHGSLLTEFGSDFGASQSNRPFWKKPGIIGERWPGWSLNAWAPYCTEQLSAIAPLMSSIVPSSRPISLSRSGPVLQPAKTARAFSRAGTAGDRRRISRLRRRAPRLSIGVAACVTPAERPPGRACMRACPRCRPRRGSNTAMRPPGQVSGRGRGDA
jgi:hypothetical protein